MKMFAPASIGNLSVGFDALGLALEAIEGDVFGDVVALRAGPQDDWVLRCTGPFAHELPENPEENIVMASCRRFERKTRAAGKEIETLKVTLDKRLPVGSGLGSSACSIVATLAALNRFFGRPLSHRELLELMAQMEGEISGDVHLDNIAPSLLGGLRLCLPDGASQYGLPWPGRWQVLVAWPGIHIATKAARELLPDRLQRSTAVAHGAQFAHFVHELYAGEPRDAARCLKDLIAEPWRKDLIPGFDEARAALMHMGALAFGISGSGPTVFAIVDDSRVAAKGAEWLQQNFLQNEQGFVRRCRADLAGARRLNGG
ncbi:MAG: homoserine kinase [Pseudomonadota bacterium]